MRTLRECGWLGLTHALLLARQLGPTFGLEFALRRAVQDDVAVALREFREEWPRATGEQHTDNRNAPCRTNHDVTSGIELGMGTFRRGLRSAARIVQQRVPSRRFTCTVPTAMRRLAHDGRTTRMFQNAH